MESFSGSWFLCDAASLLLAGAHGSPEHQVNPLLRDRIRKEFAVIPTFNEALHTVTGKPHGHILYFGTRDTGG